MPNEELLKWLDDLTQKFLDRADEEFSDRWSRWPKDLTSNEIHEVVGALLARQMTLNRELATNPPLWTGHIAPLILRAMADVYINVAWILKDPFDRSKKFILYGLGQEKLQLEHRRAELDTREARAGEREYLEGTETWINRQRALFLTDVNLGSWSGISTRNMAIEADCLDFYNYVYTPFSGCVHSTWGHVARYNLEECQNPLHRYHNVPTILNAPVDLDYLYLSAKYLQKTFHIFDTNLGIECKLESAFDLLCAALDERKSAEPADPS